ncbi:hypothetical protein ACJA25_00770 [Mycoplasmopsis hyopharyngis]|uniref:hypothetical protein n=1 Tax=Mycoplasmopsis hyopharyngis TaxID=29558 RepID=UPI0038736F0E
MKTQADKKIFIFHYWKDFKKHFQLEIMSFLIILIIFLAITSLSTYFLIYKLPKFYPSKNILIVFLVIEGLALIPTLIVHIVTIIYFIKAIKKYEKVNKLFDKSFDEILVFDENKYNYSLSSMRYYLYNGKIPNKISNIIKMLESRKKIKSREEHLKNSILAMIVISLFKNSEKFENQDDQYYFMMKKFIELFQKFFKYSIEDIKNTYNKLLNIN